MTVSDVKPNTKRRRWPRILGLSCLGVLVVLGVFIVLVWFLLTPRGDGGRTERLLTEHVAEHHPEGAFGFKETFDKTRNMQIRAELHFDESLAESEVSALHDFMAEQFTLASERDWSVLQQYTLVFPDGEIRLDHANQTSMIGIASELIVETSVTEVFMGSDGWINARTECAFADEICLERAAEAALFGFDRVVAERTDLADLADDVEAPFYYYALGVTYTGLPYKYDVSASPTSSISVRMRGDGADLRGQVVDTVAAWPHLTTRTGEEAQPFGYFVYTEQITLEESHDEVTVRPGYEYVAGNVREADQEAGRETLTGQLHTHGGSTTYVVE